MTSRRLRDERLDLVWKALADPTRRQLLDLLRDGPRTTGNLSARFAVSRFAVMKHLGILERAGLVLIERRGTQRFNFLNPVPIREIYERWMTPYAERGAADLLRLRRFVERDAPKRRPT